MCIRDRFIEDKLVWNKSVIFENYIKEAVDIQKAMEESKPLCTSKEKSKEIRIRYQNLAKEIIQTIS